MGKIQRKVKLGDIMATAQVLQSKAGSIKGVNTVMSFTKLIDALDEPSKAFFKERDRLIQEGIDKSDTLSEETKKPIMTEAVNTEVNEAINAMMEEEVDFSFGQTFTLRLKSGVDDNRFDLGVSSALMQFFGNDLKIYIDGELQVDEDEVVLATQDEASLKEVEEALDKIAPAPIDQTTGEPTGNIEE